MKQTLSNMISKVIKVEKQKLRSDSRTSLLTPFFEGGCCSHIYIVIKIDELYTHCQIILRYYNLLSIICI